MDFNIYKNFNPSYYIILDDEIKELKKNENGNTLNENNINEKKLNENNLNISNKTISDNIDKINDIPNLDIAIKIGIQYILNKQPLPINRDDIFNIINIYIPENINKKDRQNLINILNKTFEKSLGVKLLYLNDKRRKQYVLSQNIIYEKHNNLLLTDFDHKIRGFLIFLFPFFKIFHNKVPLKYLLYELTKVGYKTIRNETDVYNLITSQTNSITNNISNNFYSGELTDPIDYFIYLKKLSYIDFYLDNITENNMDGLYCVSNIRFEKEINEKSYIKKLMNISNKTYKIKDIISVFGEKYFKEDFSDLL